MVDLTDLSEAKVEQVHPCPCSTCDSLRGRFKKKERKREMFRTTLTTVEREEALAQKALYESLPALSEREQKMLTIYDAVLAGEKLINLRASLVTSDATKLTGTPKVAVAPISAKKVTYERKVPSKYFSRKVSFVYRAGSWRYRFPARRYNPYQDRVTTFLGTAIAPSILPTVRDQVEPNDLLIWEPIWVGDERVINADPAIIRPVTTDLYRVIAAWDLTSVEIEILREG